MARVTEAATKAWICYSTTGKPSVGSVEKALAAAGIDLLPKPNPKAGPGVLFFDAFSRDLCEMIRESSARGTERVLAIAASRSALGNGSPWHLLEAGASDVFVWEQPDTTAAQIAARLRRWEELDGLLHSAEVEETLVGQSPAWRSVVRQIVEAAHFTDASILLMGETGTGKELVAQLIHALDHRANKGEFVILDCATVVPTLSGSEFFGHEKGAFTGAIAPRDGAFAMADDGTLFLDEVGELPLPLQAELLRVIQEGMYKRVGSDVWRRTNFRLVCATNRDLVAEESKRQFRRDLYYRIAAWVFRLPSLRERAEDIPLLARHFLKQARPGKEVTDVDDAVLELLTRREYPGNVRDLRQLVFRIANRHEGPGLITVGDVPPEERPTGEWTGTDWRDAGFDDSIRRALIQRVKLRDIGKAANDAAMRIAVTEEDGNLQRAARRLGVTDRAVQMYMAGRRRDGSGNDAGG
jgi:transcriptional regulator with GAF, ATPase, and Fis domain